MNACCLVPGHGRDYSSKSSVLRDFNAGLAFIIADEEHPRDGAPVTKDELIVEGYDAVHIRYNGARRVVVASIKGA